MAVAFPPPNSPRRRPTRRTPLQVVPQQPGSVTPLSARRQPRQPQLGVQPPVSAKRVRPNRMLVTVERGAALVTLVLGSAVLSLYGLTVYSQQKWSREYHQLQQLQRYERQLAIAAEMLKNEMAQQAERPNGGLIPQNPENTIFLVPAPERNLPASPSAPPPPMEPETPTPLGY
ncbi:MAG: hypothetical protein LRZ84_05145 [Desertifilum sp.]|nr:hypothetical protein [Desertifilum sp.]